VFGYHNRWLDIDLHKHTFEIVGFDERTLKDFYGGCGLGAKILYDRVKPGVEWDSPENCLIIAGGPLNGSKAAGSGTHCQISKGPLTNGAVSTQANGYLGAYLSSSGFDGMIITGKSDSLVSLYVHDGKVEFLDACKHAGKDAYKTELSLKDEIGLAGRRSSVFAIGPAGENLVKFACVTGDNGHVCSHNGIGAVWGSKNLKAIAVARGSAKVELFDAALVNKFNKEIFERFKADMIYEWGTTKVVGMFYKTGLVPYKNMTSMVIPDDAVEKLTGIYHRSVFEMKREPCYACPSNHCHQVKVTEGKYKGFTGDEAEYELMAGAGPLIGNPDPGAVIMLTNLFDNLGLDGNESTWLLGFAIECFERGILTLKDTNGLELRWGNIEAAAELIRKVAKREGIGNLLAEGVKRSAEAIGGEALDIGVYQMKGHAPRGHDHRVRWTELFDTAVSNCGTNESVHPRMSPEEAFSADAVATAVYKGKTRMFVDSLVLCMFATMTGGSTDCHDLPDLLNAATGWSVTTEDSFQQALRSVNLYRVFNLRHGIGPDVEYPSKRYSSVPVDGPVQGKDIMIIWDDILDRYYSLMKWNRSTGWPFPETLRELGLGFTID